MSNKADLVSMNQEEKRELKPKLRFSEFIDDWRIAKIGDFVESYKGGAPLTPSDFLPYSNYEVIPKKAISEGMWLKIDVEKPTYCKESFYKENLQSVVDNTYLITTLRDLVPSGPSIGYVVKYASKKNYILAQGVYGLKPNKTIIPDFLIHFSNTGKYRKMMQSVMVGSTQVHIRNGVYLDLSISVPILEEQQNIADCLSSIGDRITAETQKLDTLKAHKKGLMQQLFSTEGQTLPKLRFSQFCDAGEWEEKELKSICQMQAGKFVSASDISEKHEKSLYPCYGGNGLRGYTKTYTHLGIYPLIGRQGALCGNVKLGAGQFHATEHAVVATPKNHINVNWLFYELDFLNLNRYATGQAQPGLSVEVLEKISITVPKTENEQKKIANCLSSLDELIAIQAQKIDTLKTHKKGLMQQLFPTVDDVSG